MLEYNKQSLIKESVIQSELYLACKKAGLQVDLQYTIGIGNPNRSMPDCVIVQNYCIMAIVEIKNYKAYSGLSVISQDQIKRYKSYGVPVFVLYSRYDIPHLIRKLLDVRNRFLGKANLEQTKYFIADKKSEELKQFGIDLVVQIFNETFPNYGYTEKYSLELLAIAVEKIGAMKVAGILLDGYYTVDDFMEELKSYITWVERKRTGGSLFQTSGVASNELDRFIHRT